MTYDPSLLRPSDTYFRNESPPVINMDTGEVVRPTPDSLLFVTSAGGHAARVETKANADTDVVLGRDALDRLITWLTFLRDCEQDEIDSPAFLAAALAAKGGVTP